MKNVELHVFSDSQPAPIGRWTVECKKGFYFDWRDCKIKPEGPKHPVILPTSSLERRGLGGIGNPFKWINDLIRKK